MTELGLTPSQTVGPYLGIGLLGGPTTNRLVDESDPRAIRIRGVLVDGAGDPVPDGMVEIWQANAAGRYAHPADDREIAARGRVHGLRPLGNGGCRALRVHHGEARSRAVGGRPTSGAAPSRGSLRSRPPQARCYAHVLPRRGGGERRGSRPPRARARGAGDPRRARGGRRASLRHRPPGRPARRRSSRCDSFRCRSSCRRSCETQSRIERGCRGCSMQSMPSRRRVSQPASSRPTPPLRIGEACRADRFDAARIADDGRAVGNPAEPLVRELRTAVGDRRG